MLLFFFFNDTATTEIYTLSLHDALPISFLELWPEATKARLTNAQAWLLSHARQLMAYTALILGAYLAISALDRKSTRLNSSHSQISYAVFCLKKKKNKNTQSKTHEIKLV